ncbi:TPA: DUF1090 domain-containing protein [Salmonella enterica subsp. enterica serovar Muenchen]|nr:DUF1090 domain-containing protein [Salmonella enterica subsp. enterica serovar Muenchen]ECG0447053.1 DUF1090 domain-containing protein [Salmonella enterica]ECJ4482676.1 DUF1090 domain-containing protein [Salmonella enterica subsp. diarizonae]EBY3556150.1 DUF1090 domain-containing protein [Salmonella enterica subsp. enterica serovar Muenchen]ECZ0254672.1 DUF1090 domain-containing protein [Salmonella enterica subsp. diarizonae]
MPESASGAFYPLCAPTQHFCSATRQLSDSSGTQLTYSGLIIYCSRTYADSYFTNNPLQLMTSMKPQFLRVTVLAGLLYSFMVSGAMAGNYRGCEYKRRHLEHHLEYAQAYNNIHRMAGLQRALRHIDEYCTDGRLPEQKDRKVANKQRKVTKRQYELEQARISGKSEKITDRQAKLAEAREELAQARAELNY